jgi:hypothetical protein
MDASHHMSIRELDLSSCHPNTIADKINAVPVLKTSAGKNLTFSFLFFVFAELSPVTAQAHRSRASFLSFCRYSTDPPPQPLRFSSS